MPLGIVWVQSFSRAVCDEYDLAAYHLIHYAQLDDCVFAAANHSRKTVICSPVQ